MRYRVTTTAPCGGLTRGRRTSGRRTRQPDRAGARGRRGPGGRRPAAGRPKHGAGTDRFHVVPRSSHHGPRRGVEQVLQVRPGSGPGQGDEVLGHAVELEGQRPRVGVVGHQQVEHCLDPGVAPVAPPVGHEALVRGQHHLVAGRARERIGLGSQHGLHRAQQHDGPLEAAAEVEEPPGRPPDGALHGQPRQRAQRHDDPIQRLGGPIRVHGEALEHLPRRRREELPNGARGAAHELRLLDQPAGAGQRRPDLGP